MQLLWALESIRVPFLDRLFSLITYLGDETMLIVLIICMLWCVDKRKGYCLFVIAMTGTAVNQLLKAIFLIPRPWVQDPSFPIVESARAGATGYSFPSGHTQNVTSSFSAFAIWAKRKWVTLLCAALILLTGFSRMYLGVHTPLDVGVSLFVGLGTTLLCMRIYESWSSRSLRLLSCLSVLGLVVYLLLAPKGAANVQEFDAHGLESGYTLLGAALGLSFSWFLDEKYLHYEIKARPLAQAAKLICGLGLILAMKSLLKAPLNQLCGESPFANCLRYFLIALFAGAVWPLTFPFWAKLGSSHHRPKKEDA